MPEHVQLWTNDPSVLLSTDLSVHPLEYNATCNSITRTLILIFILGALGYQSLGPSFPLFLIVLAIIYYSNFMFGPYMGPLWQPIKEAFVNAKDSVPGFEDVIPDLKQYHVTDDTVKKAYDSPSELMGPNDPNQTMPTATNPFMNVLLDELQYNPTRAAAAPVNSPLVKATLKDYFHVQWFNDPTDVFGRSQGQRQFYTMPNTSIPNDVGSYQNWLYLIPGKTCKQGGRENCVPATNTLQVPWLSKPN